MCANRGPGRDTSSAGLLLGALADPVAALKRAPSEVDLTLRLLRRSRLLARIACQVRDQGALDAQPPVVRDQLVGAMVAASARARLAMWELDRVGWALGNDNTVPVVVLKGGAYALLGLPNAAGRSFADIDLLVPEARLPYLEARLKSLGWQFSEISDYDERYYRQWAHELPPLKHVEREVEVDLHHNLLMRTARLKPSAALLLEAVREVPGSRFKVLAPVDMVLHAMVHLFYGGEMDGSLRELVDIDDLLRHFGATEPGFWEQFWPRAEELDLARPAFYGLRYARFTQGTPVPEAVVAASQAGAPTETIVWLMDRLVPQALLLKHPDAPSMSTGLARLLLFVRSHWVKMPFVMLARHLAYKSYVNLLRMP